MNSAFMGTMSVPIVATSLTAGIKFLPYDLATNVDNDQFHIYNVKMEKGENDFRVSRGLRRDRPIYINNSASILVSWPECILSLQSKSAQSCILRTDSTYNSRDAKNQIAFQLSHDAYVDLCIDSRVPLPPPWAMRLGFRRQQGQKILTN